jgi:methyl-accepting chemotaxis protein
LAVSRAGKVGGIAAIGRWVIDRSIRTKILGAVGIFAAMALVMGIMGIVGLQQASNDSHDIAQHSLTEVATAGDMSSAFLHMRLDSRQAAMAVDSAGVQAAYGMLNTDYATFQADLQKYRSVGALGAASETLLQDLSTSVQQYMQLQRTVVRANADRHDIAGWAKINNAQVKPIDDRVGGDLDTLVGTASGAATVRAHAAQSSASTARKGLLIALVVGVLLGSAAALFVAGGIVRATKRVSQAVQGLAEGDLTASAGVTSHDELGRMAQHLDHATERLRETIKTVAGNAYSLASSSEELSAVSQQLAAGAEETSTQVTSVSAASEQINRNVQTVAAGAEQMGASIREIAQNASEAARVGAEAVGAAQDANATIAALGESSAEIGNVIKLITSVAEQTNLLALNATIEAARAGDAGKGFAVVANEVKELAQQTARATEDISARVQAIQGDSVRAVDAIGRISEVINRIGDYQTSIASAVEEQSLTTEEMSRNVTEASTGVEQISANISGVATAVEDTTASVTEAAKAASELARMSGELSSAAANFTV